MTDQPFHVIVGAGGPAVAAARLFADEGERVRLVSRGGGGPEHRLIERIALDAGDAGRLTEVAEGAATLVNCAVPPYHTWPVAVPPLFRSILTAAERTGAGYVMLGNLYGYGPVDGPVTEDHPLAASGPKGRVRAEMWREAERAHAAGRVKVTEVRAGQFLGAGAKSVFTLLVQPKVLAGRLAVVPAELDVPHAFSAIGDVARALVTVARDDRAWGRPWHAPAIHASVREVATRLADIAAAPAPELATMTDRELTLLAYADPFWDELWETHHMSHRPFLLDSSRLEGTFGLKPAPLDEVLTDGLRALGG